MYQDKNGKHNERSKWKNGKIMVKWKQKKLKSCKQCFTYSENRYMDLGIENYARVNESNFIDDIDELWIGDNARW